MVVKKEIQRTRDQVEDVLKDNEKARDSDKYLIAVIIEKVAIKMGKGVYIPEDVWDAIPSFESLTRARRYIQNTEGKYLSKKQIEANRKEREEEFRQEYGKK